MEEDITSSLVLIMKMEIKTWINKCRGMVSLVAQTVLSSTGLTRQKDYQFKRIRTTSLLFVCLFVFVNLTHARFIREEVTSVKKIPPSNLPVGKYVKHFLNDWLKKENLVQPFG